MPYAINVSDLTKYRDDLALKLILGAQVGRTTVNCEPGRMDGGGVLFTSPDEQAGALIEVLRKRIKKHELRCYHSKTGNGGWTRV